MLRISLDTVVQKSRELPALPQVVDKVLELSKNPDTSIESISTVISADQVLTFRLLKLANSAYFGFARKISTVRDAVILLGTTITRNLVLAVSVQNVMNREVTGYVLQKGELWRHSMVAAILARHLAEKHHSCDPEKAFTAALMHDIGKIVINTYIASEFDEVVALSDRDKMPFSAAEEAVLGFNHAQVGGRIAVQWNLPDEMAEAIEFHHEPSLAETNPQLCAVVHIADALCMIMGVGLGGDGLLYPIDPRAMEILGLHPDDLEILIAEGADIVKDNSAEMAI